MADNNDGTPSGDSNDGNTGSGMKNLNLGGNVIDGSVGASVSYNSRGMQISRKDLENPRLEYPMASSKRGLCVIINQENFDKQATGQSKRDGTNMDADNCMKTFKKLGFEVKRHNDLKTEAMRDKLKEYSLMDHKNHDCFVLIMLSHGFGEYIYGTDDKVKIGDLLANFKGNRCQSLLGKPKLFFIQACRGSQFDRGETPRQVYSDDNEETTIIRKIPVEADIMIAYATCPGYYAWRNNQDGSWFIRSICKVFLEHSEDFEIMQMMALVHRLVAYDYESSTMQEGTNRMKQMPSCVHMLTKLLYLRKNTQ